MKIKVKVRIIKNASELDDIINQCDAKKVIGELSKDMAKRIEDEINGQQAKTNHRAARRIIRNRRKKTD